MSKCLRALPLAMASEHGTSSDLFLAAPGELLSIPLHSCAEASNPSCQCRRIFIGLESGNPTTLARVCTADLDDLDRECRNSDAVIMAIPQEVDDNVTALLGIAEVAEALQHYAIGSVVRVDRTNQSLSICATYA